MTCYHPAHLFKIGYDQGKCITKYLPYEVVAYSYHHGNRYTYTKQALSKINLNDYELVDSHSVVEAHLDFNVRSEKPRLYVNPYVVPCGQCVGCRKKQAQDWCTRMYFESLDHEKNSFITLTYADEYVPLSQYVDKEGEIQTSLSLRSKEFSDFMKRLRYYLGETKIRFYGCGEYGGTTHRPHYHAIIFGEDFRFDRIYKGQSKSGFAMYDSPTLQKAWKYGYSTVMDMTAETCMYTAKYVNKKALGLGKDYYKYFNVENQFSRMSLKPGIGKNYYDNHKDEIYERQEMFISAADRGYKVKPPKYYDDLYDMEEPIKMGIIKEARAKMAEDTLSEKLEKSDKTYLELLADEEYMLKERMQNEKGGLL